MSSKELFGPFKFAWVLVVFISSLTLMVGCGLKFGESTPKPKPVKISPNRFNCLSHMGDHISNYFNDKMSDSDVVEVTNCLANAIEKFERYTHGAEGDQYRPEEFRRFIQTYFLKEKRIDDILMYEAMNFKVAIVGGNNQFVTRTELLRSAEFVKFAKEILLDLRPYISIYNFSLGINGKSQIVDSVDVDTATKILIQSGEKIGKWAGTANTDYKIDSLERFLIAIRSFSNWNEFYQAGHSADKWMKFLKAFKSALVKEPSEVIRSSDWEPLLASAASWYSVWLKYKYQISKGAILYGKGLESIISTSSMAINLLRRSLDNQEENLVGFEQINRLIDASGELGLFPENIRVTSVKKTARMLINKIFGDSSIAPARRQSAGLTRVVLARAEEEFYSWVSVQKHLAEGYLKNSETRTAVDESNRKSLINAYQVNIRESLKPFPKNAVHFIEMDHILKNMTPIFRPGSSWAYVAYPSQLEQKGLVNGIHQLSRANVIRTLVRLLFRGYSHRRNYMEGLTEDEMQAFYIDAKDLGTDLKIMDPRNSNVGRRAFMEANLFTFHSDGMNEAPPQKLSPYANNVNRSLKPFDLNEDGARAGKITDIAEIYEKPDDQLLSFKEAMELVAFVYSGGESQTRIYEVLKPQCQLETKGVRGHPMLGLNCVRAHLRSLIPMYLDNLPNMANYLESLKGNEWGEILELALEISMRNGAGSELIEYSEFAVLSMIFHYSEVLMVRFDKNEDRLVSGDEIWELVYPVFKGYLKKMAHKSFEINLDEGELKSTFAFILMNGRLPNAGTDSARIWWDTFIRSDDDTDWNISLDRGDIIRVFAAVVRSSRELKAPKPPRTAPRGASENLPISP